MTVAPTLDALRDAILSVKKPVSDEYRLKQLHDVPESKTVNRQQFLVDRCAGKTIVDVGASGTMHTLLVQAAKAVYGWDRAAAPGVEAIDLDAYDVPLPVYADVDLVVCGEVIEHLSNPGWFLTRLRAAYPCPIIVTVPNAFSLGGLSSLSKGVENCNRDHVAYYSHRTIQTLLERHGYRIAEFFWYGAGTPRCTEGLIVVTE